MAVAITAAAAFTACNADDDFDFEPRRDIGTPDTRAVSDGSYWIVDFENASPGLLAGPTSYGANLYEGYSGTDPGRYTSWVDTQSRLTFGLNKDGYGGTYNYWNGGIAVSNWNQMSNIAGESGEWWYSYQNQCSVYNTASVDGANEGAGYSGSKFGVVYGYTDTYSGFVGCSNMYLANHLERTFDRMYVCNSSYGYGVIVHGNSFTQGSLPSKNGWFKLVARGYKAGATTPVATDEIYLADYRDGATVCLTGWTLFDLTNIKKQKVNKIELDFVGSDSGAYGLNTPAYVCIDDIRVSKN